MDVSEPKRKKSELSKSPIVVEEKKRTVNYGTWRVKRSHDPWSLEGNKDFIHLNLFVVLFFS